MRRRGCLGCSGDRRVFVSICRYPACRVARILEIVITHFAPVLLTAGCLGAGTAILAVLRLPGRSSPLEHWTWAFAIGFGAIGWVLFFDAAAFDHDSVDGRAIEFLLDGGYLGKGDSIILTKGAVMGTAGSTSIMKILPVY